MNFKNALEQRCFEIAQEALGSSVEIEHNRNIQIENALFAEVAAFKGPPTKEVDVIVAELLQFPKIKLLVSCKQFSKRAEPAHVQEWAAVVQTMNKYSDDTLYLGMVISSNGFTSGCESWATAHNLGLIPPIKGLSLAFAPDTVLSMYRRSLIGLHKRVQLKADDLAKAPAFFDFIYSLISDYEGHENAAQDSRYYTLPECWISAFGEMYSSIAGLRVKSLSVTKKGANVHFSGGASVLFLGERVEFGSRIETANDITTAPICVKNFDQEPCSLEFIMAATKGLPVTSAADFGDYLEFGIDGRFNLGLHQTGFHLISTESPIAANRL